VKADLAQLIAGELPYILVGRDTLPAQTLLLPGSFNPLHKGHQGLLRAAEEITQRTGLFELSISNVDKPPIALPEIQRRLKQLPAHRATVLTCAPTFIQKVECFPGVWFVLGYDTAVRLLSLQYHPDIPNMLARFQTLGTRFVVAGRLCHGDFCAPDTLPIPTNFANLFIPIPETQFREDISSTTLRSVPTQAKQTKMQVDTSATSL
jgi:hypothetical protein